MEFQHISTADLHQLVGDPNTSIIDVRPVEAYNGWKLRNEKRSGHVQGARSLPVKWARYMDWIEIVRSKGILPEHTVVIYGYEPEEARLVAERFSRAGYERIRIYADFLTEWNKDTQLPMSYLPRYKQLVYPEWLKILMDGGNNMQLSGVAQSCNKRYHY